MMQELSTAALRIEKDADLLNFAVHLDTLSGVLKDYHNKNCNLAEVVNTCNRVIAMAKDGNR